MYFFFIYLFTISNKGSPGPNAEESYALALATTHLPLEAALSAKGGVVAGRALLLIRISHGDLQPREGGREK